MSLTCMLGIVSVALAPDTHFAKLIVRTRDVTVRSIGAMASMTDHGATPRQWGGPVKAIQALY